MITLSNKSLVEAAKKVLLSEAIESSVHKGMANRASRESIDASGLTAAERISKDAIPLGQDHVVIPLERGQVTPNRDIAAHLDKHGYSVKDYGKGLAVKKSDPRSLLSIGKVLERTNADQGLKTIYQKDPARQGISSQAKIVISRNPLDVGGMSTHQKGWESCQTLGSKATIIDNGEEKTLTQQRGSHAEYVPKDIASGTHIAYLVHKPEDVKEHYKPIARFLLKPYVSPEGHTILRPAASSYGDEWSGFKESITNWAEKHFPMKHAKYKLQKDVYPDAVQELRNYAPEHDETWINKPSAESFRETNSPKVLDHYVNTVASGDQTHYFTSNLIKNPHLSDEHIEKLVSSPHVLENDRATLLIKTKSRNVIDKALTNPDMIKHVAGNKNATTQDLQKVMDHINDKYTDVTDGSMGLHPDVVDPVAELAKHPNLSQEQADHILKNKTVYEYPGIMKHLVTKASDEKVKDYIDHINTNLDPRSREYYNDSIGNIGLHKPHLLQHLDDHAMYLGHINLRGRRENPIEFERETLRRDNQALHNYVAKNSENKEILNTLQHHGDEEVSGNAKLRLERGESRGF